MTGLYQSLIVPETALPYAERVMQAPGELINYIRRREADGWLYSQCPVCGRDIVRSSSESGLKLVENDHLCRELRAMERDLFTPDGRRQRE